jgi:hypothetical protein
MTAKSLVLFAILSLQGYAFNAIYKGIMREVQLIQEFYEDESPQYRKLMLDANANGMCLFTDKIIYR